jgi:hypothetical protein
MKTAIDDQHGGGVLIFPDFNNLCPDNKHTSEELGAMLMAIGQIAELLTVVPSELEPPVRKYFFAHVRHMVNSLEEYHGRVDAAAEEFLLRQTPRSLGFSSHAPGIDELG